MIRPETVPIDLALSYTHGFGSLAPYFDALRQGRAMARACPRCGKAWCPPRATCPDDGEATTWRELPGTGVIVAATAMTSALPLHEVPAEHVFALVRLDGAENAMFARLGSGIELIRTGLRVRMALADGTPLHPAQAVWFVAEENAP